MNRKPRQRQCKICRTKYQPQSSFQKACSVSCAIEYTRLQGAKKHRKERLESKRDYKWYLKKCEEYCNKYIKLRDKGKPCISCGKYETPENPFQAGHFNSVASRPDIRYCYSNIHGQCTHCNWHLSSNRKGYIIGLENRIGKERLDALERRSDKPLTIDDLQMIKEFYQQKIKEIK